MLALRIPQRWLDPESHSDGYDAACPVGKGGGVLRQPPLHNEGLKKVTLQNPVNPLRVSKASCAASRMRLEIAAYFQGLSRQSVQTPLYLPTGHGHCCWHRFGAASNG